MIKIGRYNTLKAERTVSFGIFLTDGAANEVLLPTKHIPEGTQLGDELEVFVYLDNKERPVATSLRPSCTVNQFAYLRVRETGRFGAFLEWGVEKDLLVPFAEQNNKMVAGQSYFVFVFRDGASGRLLATSKIHRHLDFESIPLKVGERVNGLVAGKSDIGIKVVIEHRYLGMLYKNEVYRTLRPGESVSAWVKQIRPDGKIDLSLQEPGYGAIPAEAERILTLLQAHQGHLNLSDKSSPEEIKRRLSMSKKAFKKAIGALYKARKIQIGENGIHLLEH